MHYCHNTAEHGDRRLIECIRARAYQIFENRGDEPGDALNDWQRAEREIKSHRGVEPPGLETLPDSQRASPRPLPGAITPLLTWPI